MLKCDRNTELHVHVTQAVEVMMMRAEKIHILMIKQVTKFFHFF